MPNRIHVAFVAAMLATAAFGIAQTTQIKEVSIKPTSAASGKMMYTNYCAVCHGADGRGNGPAASAMKTPPTDLTTLARSHRGRFPDTHIATVLQFGTETDAHGSQQMPIWGTAFRSLAKGSAVPDSQEHQRIANLTEYLKTLQQQ
ncbi:MAG TPA: c-type cytochrome [Acidobacteriaceae bacterium]|jgi:mono/diheme cytochrome c family protein